MYLEKFESVEEPRKISILTKDYLERSCNFLNTKRIKEKELMRMVILCAESVLLKKMLSICFWLFVLHAQRLLTQHKKNNKQKLYISHTHQQLTSLLRSKYFLLFSRLKSPKDRVLEFLPFLIGKAVLMIFEEKFNESLDEVFGIFGHSQQCMLFVYQYVHELFLGEQTLSLRTIDQMLERTMCN